MTDDGEDSMLLQVSGFFLVLSSTIPMNLLVLIDLLVIIHAYFVEWDVNTIPAKVKFWYPTAAYALGRVGHIFMSRSALQRDDKQCVKVIHLGGQYFLN